MCGILKAIAKTNLCGANSVNIKLSTFRGFLCFTPVAISKCRCEQVHRARRAKRKTTNGRGKRERQESRNPLLQNGRMFSFRKHKQGPILLMLVTMGLGRPVGCHGTLIGQLLRSRNISKRKCRGCTHNLRLSRDMGPGRARQA